MEFIIGILDDLLDGCTPEHMEVWIVPEIFFIIDHCCILGGGG